MKKLLIGLLCLAVCGTVAMTSCGKKKVEEKVEEKTITLDFTDDFVEPVPVFQYRFSGGEAVLEKYNPDMAEEDEVLPTDIELPVNPVKIKYSSPKAGEELPTAVVDGKTVFVKEKTAAPDDKIYDLVEIGAGAFAGNTDITSVVIPDTVKVIGAGAFLGCTNLTSVTLPAALEEIGDYAFAGCTALENLEIPETVESIGIFAFGEYFSQTAWYANLPNESVIVGDGILLAYNGAETSVTYGDEVKYVSYYAFTDTPVTSVTFTNKDCQFNDLAFYHSSAVVRLPEGSPKVNELKMGGVKVETFAVADAPVAEEAPVEGEEAPVEGEEAPVEGEEAPVEGEEAPVEEGEAEAEQTPAEEGEAEVEGEVVTELEEAAE